MTSPELLDFESLLSPLEGERPTGGDLREDYSADSIYYQIKDARAAARAEERSTGVGGSDQDWPGEWRTVLSLGKTILSERSKDLEVVAWMIEALVRQGGLAGLRDGLRLTRELVERYWDDLYPMPDEDGIETRVASLTGLNGADAEGTLSVPVSLSPITQEGDTGCFNLWRYRKVREGSRGPEEEQGDNTPANLADAVRRTSPDYLRDVYGDVEAAQEHFTKLCELLDQHCGVDAPPSSNIKNLLGDAREALLHIADEHAGIKLDAAPIVDLAEEPPAESAQDDAAGGNGAAAPAAAAGPPGKITNRADAIRTLKLIAEFFRETEPHSPVSSLLDKAARWGQMPLTELIRELIPDEGARRHFGVVTGIEKQEGEPESFD